MKTTSIKILIAVFWSLIIFAVSISADTLCSVDIHDRVGNGWHMYTNANLDEDGTITGITTLKNYNNFRGFTGGLFIVVVDETMEPIYTTEVHQWGLNAAGFRRKRVRTASWNDLIPEEYMARAASIAVVQQHTPTYRVWRWIYENRELIIEKAGNFIEFFQKAKNKELDEDDIWNIINDVVVLLDEVDSDVWVIDNIGNIHGVVCQVYDLAKKEKEGWVPENADDLKIIIEDIKAITEEKWDWENLDDVREIAEAIITLVGDKEGWIPDNLEDVQSILENMYSLMENEDKVPDKVKNVIEKVITGLDKLNE